MTINLSRLEKFIGIKFNNPSVLKEALTHRSYLNEHPQWPFSHNERLEYLGDAVLELAVTEFLYNYYPSAEEGFLTSLRAALVNYQMLSRVAKEINLENYIFFSKGEAKDIGRAREVILANAVEALIGAIYLDKNYPAVEDFIERFILIHLKEIIDKKLYRDAKSWLQEIIQERLKLTPIYKVLKEEGPDHNKRFVVGVFFNDELISQGEGPSKQEAEIDAAAGALKIWAAE